MHLNFRQGLVSFQHDLSGPQFLQASAIAGFIDHVVSPKPTILNVAHRNANYLVMLDEGTSAAWGPIPGSTVYLYWDIDLLTANVTRGFTLLEPYVGLTAPANPANDQHWFDLSTTSMKVYRASHSKWSEVIRVFAGRVNGGSTSNITSYGAGTQVGISADVNAGYIMLDSMLNPVRLSDGTFMTADSAVRVKTTSGTAGTQVQPASSLSIVRAETNVPRMTAVYLSGEDLVSPASSNPSVASWRRPVGLITVDLIPGELGQLVQFGEVTYDGWDFSSAISQPLYCDDAGQLTTTRPAGDVVFRLGFVKNAKTIIFQVDAEATAQGTSGSGGSVDVQGVVPIVVTSSIVGPNTNFQVAIPPASASANGYMTAGHVSTLNNYGTRITAAENTLLTKSDVGHTHPDLDVRITAIENELPNKSDVGHTHVIDSLDGVFIDTPAFGEVLTYNGASWTNMPASGGGGLPTPSGPGFVIVDPSMQYNVLSAASIPAITAIDQYGIATTVPANTPEGWVLTTNSFGTPSFQPPSGSVMSASYRLRASGSESGVNRNGTFKSVDWNDGVDALIENPDITWDGINQEFTLPGVGSTAGVWEVTIKVLMTGLNYDDTGMEVLSYGTGLRSSMINSTVCPDTRHMMVIRITSTGDQIVFDGDVCWTDTHTLMANSSGPVTVKPGLFFYTGQLAGQTNPCDLVVSFKYMGPALLGV